MMKFQAMSRTSLLRLGAVALAWALLFAHLLPELVFDWQDGGDFSHGFVVPVFAFLLLWGRRPELARLPRQPNVWGLAALGLGVVVHLVGVAASELYLQRVSMIPFLWGWALLLEGPSRARLWLLPLGFLIFMIPPPTIFWNRVSLPLQLLASSVAEGTLLLAGMNVVREGNILHLDRCSLEVAEACSGIRSLVALLALATLLAEGRLVGIDSTRTAWGKILLVVAAIPVAVAVNALRVTSAAFLGSSSGKEAVDRFHDLSGLLMFVVAFFFLTGWKEVLRWIEQRSLPPSAPS